MLKQHVLEISLKFTILHNDYQIGKRGNFIKIVLTFSGTNQAWLGCEVTTRLKPPQPSGVWHHATKPGRPAVRKAELRISIWKADVVVFLLLLCFSSFTSCNELYCVVHFDERNQWHSSGARQVEMADLLFLSTLPVKSAAHAHFWSKLFSVHVRWWC